MSLLFLIMWSTRILVCCSLAGRISKARLWKSIQFMNYPRSYIVSSVQSLSRVRLFVTLWIVVCQASPSITNSRSSLKLKSIELVMPSSHLILCRPLLFLPPISPSIRVFSNESTLRMRWPKYWSFALASFFPKNTLDWSPLEWTVWISLQSKGLSESSPTPQFKSINSLALSFLHSPTLTSINDHWKNHSLD